MSLITGKLDKQVLDITVMCISQVMKQIQSVA